MQAVFKFAKIDIYIIQVRKLMEQIHLITLLCSALSVAACATPTPQTQQIITAQMRSGIWIDVRSSAEFDTGHLKGAVNIPTDELAETITKLAPNKDSEIHLYCRSGRRADTAHKVLTGLGYTNITNEGGYVDLLKKGHQ